MLSFFQTDKNFVRFIVNHVEIYTLLACIPLCWRSDIPLFPKIAKKRQFMVQMCDFELKFHHMLLIFNK